VNFAELYAFWGRVKAAVPAAADVGANRMASAYKQRVKINLSLRSHAPHTRTPAPGGTFPAMITGELKESVLSTPAVPIGPAIFQATVSPHTIYAAYMEYGGEAHAHGNYMSWVTDGIRYYRKTAINPPRPYMKLTALQMSTDGALTRAAIGGVASVIYPVEGI
jgi:hypothetical protein